MRLPNNFGISQKLKVEFQKLSPVETGPKENRGFERPKVSHNLSKILPKMLTKNTFQK